MTPRNSGRFSGAGVASALPIRVGVSRCLLGEEVRFDGGHKRDRFLTDVLGRHVEWVPVCPEVEAGFGTPREAMRLLGDAEHPKLITMTSKRDMTTPLAVYSKRKLEMLEQTELSGYIFKKDSPSCGIERVKLFNTQGISLSPFSANCYSPPIACEPPIQGKEPCRSLSAIPSPTSSCSMS